jgi:hypothetical protein
VTSAHIFFIPGMIMIGMIVGFIFGARAARNQIDMQARRDADREAARTARAAKRSAGIDTPPAEPAAKDGPPAEAKSPEAEQPEPEPKADAKSEPAKAKGGKKR